MERRLAAIMAADVVGYSRSMAHDEAGTYASLRAALTEIVGPAVNRHGGRIFKTTGDGFLATFPSVGEALGAAVEIQDGFADRPLTLRIGLNLGDVIEDEGGDVFGDGVNVAARLEAMADPGGIWVGAPVVRSAGKHPDLRFVRIGRRRARNMDGLVEVYAVRWGPHLAAARRRVTLRRVGTAAAAVVALVGAGVAAWSYGDGVLATVSAGLQEASSTVAPDDADTRPAVAVLPFDNMSGDPSQDYFSDGLTEDIITDLSRAHELMVIARNSTFAFKNRPTDIRTVGEELDARYVVEGSARRAGDQLRVIAQLIDTDTGAHLWSRSYDRRVEDVFAVQTDLTTQIVASLVSYVRQSEAAAVTRRPTESLRAYDLLLQGRNRFPHGSLDARALREAQDLFRRAVEADPGYAAAHAQLGLTHIVDHLNGLSGPPDPRDLEEGLRQVREAIRLQPDLAFAYQVLSFGLAESGEYEAGMRAAERAVDLNPSDPDSLMALAKAQVRFGAYPDAVASAASARRLHPMAPPYYPYVHAQALYAADRQDEADDVLSGCLLRAPDERNCLRMQAVVLVRLERAEEAREAMKQLTALEPGFSIEAERAQRRFGDSPLMQRYLDDLSTAGAPPVAGQARRQLDRRRAA